MGQFLKEKNVKRDMSLNLSVLRKEKLQPFSSLGLYPGGGGGTRYILGCGRCGLAPCTLTLFKTKTADFPTLFKTEFRFLIPSLRHS